MKRLRCLLSINARQIAKKSARVKHGGAHAVTIGNIPSLERFQENSNGESRMNCITSTCVVVALLVMPTIRILAQDRSDANPCLDDVVGAFTIIPEKAREVEFRSGATAFPEGGHFQGIQSVFDPGANKQICFVTRDSLTTALFITIEFPAGPKSFGTLKHLQILPSDGRQPPLRHPGGTQLIGNYLVVGVEDNQARRRSQVQFWDVSKPLAPVQRKPLTVVRESPTPEDKTAGAVGIVKRDTDHLLAVANWGCRALDFYVSNGFPLSDNRCRFEFNVRWSKDAAYKDNWKPDLTWGNYQSIALVADRASRIYLLACHTDAGDKDFIDLCSIDLTEHPTRIVQKLANKHMTLKGGAHFNAAGGIFVKSRSELVSYSTEGGVPDKISVNVSP